MKVGVTFDCKPISELTQLMVGIRRFHYFAADRGFGQTSAYCACWVKGDPGVEDKIGLKISEHFGARLSLLTNQGMEIDGAISFNIVRNPHEVTLVVEKEIEIAIQSLGLVFLPKPSGHKRTFFCGKIVPSTIS